VRTQFVGYTHLFRTAVLRTDPPPIGDGGRGDSRHPGGGYEDVNDADRLALDPVMRQIVGGHAVYRRAASASQVGRFDTEGADEPGQPRRVADMQRRRIDRSPPRGEAAAVDHRQLGEPDIWRAGRDSMTHPGSHPVDAQEERPIARKTIAFSWPAGRVAFAYPWATWDCRPLRRT
jgi:hypothetical protein